jgi:hypothetical protein
MRPFVAATYRNLETLIPRNRPHGAGVAGKNKGDGHGRFPLGAWLNPAKRQTALGLRNT